VAAWDAASAKPQAATPVSAAVARNAPMNDQSIRFRIGIFVLGALLLLAVLIILFGGFPNYFKPTNSYTIQFDNAPNIAPGTPVRRSGVKIGEVRRVELDNETGKVNVVISIDPAYTVRKSDLPTQVAGFLGGDTTIDFLPQPNGQAVGREPIEPGSTIVGAKQTDATAFLQKAADLADPAQKTMQEMNKAFKTFEEMALLMKEMVPELRKTNLEVLELAKSTNKSMPALNETNAQFQLAAKNWGAVGERVNVLLRTNEEKFIKTLDRFEDTLKKVGETFSSENQRYLTDIMKNAKISSDKLDSIVRSTEEMLRESQKTLKHVNDALVRSDDVLANMQKATKPMAERSEAILKNIEESTDKLNKVLADARDLMNSVARRDGTLQKLLSDPSLYRSLDETACQFSKLVPQLQHILRDVEIFADKIARHPESLGISGVVRPGTGLKEPPSVLPWRPHY
jgi:phospholipid/cholesterol/gamma-HCH transport system substrate-binding protein